MNRQQRRVLDRMGGGGIRIREHPMDHTTEGVISFTYAGSEPILRHEIRDDGKEYVVICLKCRAHAHATMATDSTSSRAATIKMAHEAWCPVPALMKRPPQAPPEKRDPTLWTSN